MTTLHPKPVPVHAVGDDQPRPQPLRVRAGHGSRSLITLAGVALTVLCLSVDQLPQIITTIGGLLSLPVTLYLALTAEWQ